MKNNKVIGYLQILSISLIWVLFSVIGVWIFQLIRQSLRLHDAPDASVAISIVAIPIFLLLASVLTYVFVGLRRGREKDGPR